MLLFFVFKQKTAYEMRMSDWSSDVCSSDLLGRLGHYQIAEFIFAARLDPRFEGAQPLAAPKAEQDAMFLGADQDARAVRHEDEISPFDRFFERDRKSTRLNSSH